ncbi:MAG: gephyrin-like molybdotransferase Glp [Candidatus Bathyarchaeia archaeon]
MTTFKKLISREEALEIIGENIEVIKNIERIELGKASGRVLAESIIADFDVPPFKRSAMDGYAVIAEDTYEAGTFNPIQLRLIGVQHAGDVFAGEVRKGECVQIATGSPIPKGADSVIMVEYTEDHDDVIEIQKPVYPGANIAKAGEDIKKGERVLEAGTYLTPARVGAAAALGREWLEVFKKPRVAVYSTGPEIVPQGQPLEPGQIYDINSYTLKSVIDSHGCEPVRAGILRDTRQSIEDALTESASYDMAVFSGGSSVGARDIFSSVVAEKGKIFFHGVLVKPGKPTLLGVISDTPLFGMPGYPTSCLSNAYIFLIPALRKMAGLPQWTPRKTKAHLARKIASTTGREQFLTVRLKGDKAYPVYKQSGDITSIARADGYIILPVNQDTMDEGEVVSVYLFQ